MRLRTTTIGSYPKPELTPGAKGFDVRRGRWSATWTEAEYEATMTDDARAALDCAVAEVVAEQAEIGIDVVTDGEIRREHYIYYHCGHLAGFDFMRLAKQVMRDGGWVAEVPVVVGPIRAGAPFLVRDWRVAQAATDRPVKVALPGPLTIIESTADSFYGDERRLASDLAAALSVEIRALAAAGCRWIQIDEPVFARDPAKANAFGIEAVARCFHGLPPGVRRVLHICCGYPSSLDDDNYPKADPASYFGLADALDAAPVDAVSIEDAHRHNDLRLLDRCGSRR